MNPILKLWPVLLFWLFVNTAYAQMHDPAPQKVTSVYIPDTLYFCGERVPLEDPDIRERLDYELLLNTYRHARMLWLLKLEGRWREPLVRGLREANVPDDMFYVAACESDLNHYVESSKGALGIWQFMKETALEMGLEITDELDQRRDPILTTRAVCKYFNQAHKKFGNWTSAAASYNRGMNGLQRALDGQKVSSYYDLYLNPETKHYIFRVLALKLIFENPARYGFIIQEADKLPPFRYTEVSVSETIPSLADFAKQHGINYKILKYYNPWLEGGDYSFDVPKGKTYVFKIPAK
ncbi:MAG: lytic transglycosylase domain-containing protein [Cytophagales bacterium]|nr:MAG: lytic transglycosylase domain-containing protein [Cytophagales bacterium]TAF60026.1 MAG: lytic transglycosylase domain-containing protein [Cytophagales bacterium]